jgi:hypothetical protein
VADRQLHSRDPDAQRFTPTPGKGDRPLSATNPTPMEAGIAGLAGHGWYTFLDDFTSSLSDEANPGWRVRSQKACGASQPGGVTIPPGSGSELPAAKYTSSTSRPQGTACLAPSLFPVSASA